MCQTAEKTELLDEDRCTITQAERTCLPEAMDLCVDLADSTVDDFPPPKNSEFSQVNSTDISLLNPVVVS